jgi:hypothetical protein
MFTDQLTRAIAAARTTQLNHLSAELWAYAAGALSDDDAQAAAEAIRERKLASAPNPCPLVLVGLPGSIVTFHEGKTALNEVEAADAAEDSSPT